MDLQINIGDTLAKIFYFMNGIYEALIANKGLILSITGGAVIIALIAKITLNFIKP